jgi:hypothetical protein
LGFNARTNCSVLGDCLAQGYRNSIFLSGSKFSRSAAFSFASLLVFKALILLFTVLLSGAAMVRYLFLTDGFAIVRSFYFIQKRLGQIDRISASSNKIKSAKSSLSRRWHKVGICGDGCINSTQIAFVARLDFISLRFHKYCTGIVAANHKYVVVEYM